MDSQPKKKLDNVHQIKTTTEKSEQHKNMGRGSMHIPKYFLPGKLIAWRPIWTTNRIIEIEIDMILFIYGIHIPILFQWTIPNKWTFG